MHGWYSRLKLYFCTQLQSQGSNRTCTGRDLPGVRVQRPKGAALCPIQKNNADKRKQLSAWQAALALSGQRDHRREAGLPLFHLIPSSAALTVLPRQKFKRSFPSLLSACLFLAHKECFTMVHYKASLIPQALAENTFATSIAIRKACLFFFLFCF